ncbi:MAG: 16S rRNA (guanine(966)-N(2))-methyltransferase RsmD [Deltaproteobacteria bacterium]|nr:16S rRNA (guanine(966)-N(2))-methyltransferase RsmD [Deltaproteobacteria bacterium]
MRIIAGSAKGKKIHAPVDGKIVRPALGKVREAIFSILGAVDQKVILDVFAGTGSLGLEGLSRGAAACYFIESHPTAIKCIMTSLEHLGFLDVAHVFKRILPHGLKGLRLTKKPDIIFCDPPYDKNLVNRTLKALVQYKFVDRDSTVIVEHTRREQPDLPELTLVKQKKYGQTIISFLVLSA